MARSLRWASTCCVALCMAFATPPGVAATAATAAPATASPVAETSAEKRSVESPAATSKWRCEAFDNPSTTGKRCVRFTRIKRSFQAVFRSGVSNPDPGPAHLSCTSTVAETMSYSFSASINGEAGFVFGKVSATVTGGVSKSVTTGKSVSVSKKVPSGKKLACDYGVYNYRARGILRTTTCNAGSGCNVTRAPFRVRAPQRTWWKLHIVR